MLKLLTAGLTALFVTASPLAYAQVPAAPERLSPADLAKLTDARIELVKAALQLTPDQMKYWPAVEDAIRVRAQNRQNRIARIAETVGKRSDDSVVEILRNRDPIDFLNRRADALAQRSADLRKLADAWQPLYKTLTPEQRQRMAALTIFALHEMSNALEQRRMQSEDDDEWLVIIQ
jgi:ABC-type transporter Mla subunit MlaD